MRALAQDPWIMSKPRNIIEVCVDTVDAAVCAERCGASRLELCTALDVGGVTPFRSLIAAVRRAVTCPLIVLIRPRTGDFVLRPEEAQQVMESTKEALEEGVDGIAVGALTSDGRLDASLLGSLRNRFSECQLVMHRAFDLIADKSAALEQLVDFGFDRILTSGGPAQAQHGLDNLRKLQFESTGRITIMPGGGVTAENASAILAATGCHQLHGSFRSTDCSNAQANHFGTNRSLDVLALKELCRRVSVDS